ncbi:MBL fold metallo-hydrolase [Pseudochelatococcus sp. B33]
MPYLSEPEPPRGIATALRPGIRRIVARNPGVMTCHGTNTYLLDGIHGRIVIDPGPADEAHLNDVLEATSGRVDRILLTHTHGDHAGNAEALRMATAAPIHAHAAARATHHVDEPLEDGETIAGLKAVHTPGHAPDHLCFAGADGILFSGDHVMGWSSTVVGPPHGDMADYLASLRKLLRRSDRLYLPGHGPAITDPKPYVDDLLRHRNERETAIVAVLRDRSMTAAAIARDLYAKIDPTLARAAERNVRCHLVKLAREGKVEERGDLWRNAGAADGVI